MYLYFFSHAPNGTPVSQVRSRLWWTLKRPSFHGPKMLFIKVRCGLKFRVFCCPSWSLFLMWFVFAFTVQKQSSPPALNSLTSPVLESTFSQKIQIFYRKSKIFTFHDETAVFSAFDSFLCILPSKSPKWLDSETYGKPLLCLCLFDATLISVTHGHAFLGPAEVF